MADSSGNVATVLLLFVLVMGGWGLMDFSLYYSSYLQGRFPLDKGVAVFLIAIGVLGMATISSAMFYLFGGSHLNLSRPVTLFPFVSGFTNGMGYLSYYALSRLLEASTLSPMVSMYILFPIVYGLTVRGEKINAQKLGGICLAFASILMIAMGSEEDYEVAADPYARPNSFKIETIQWLATLFVSFGVASASGVIAGSSGIKHAETSMILFSSVGFASLALVWIPFNLSSFSLPSLHAWHMCHTLLVLSGSLFVVGMSSMFALSGQSGGEISVVVPLTSLYTMVPTVLGYLLLDETMPPLKLAGIWLAFMGVYLLTLSKAKKPVQKVGEVGEVGEEDEQPLLGQSITTSPFEGVEAN